MCVASCELWYLLKSRTDLVPRLITNRRSHADTETNRKSASTCANSFTVTSLDPVAYASYQYLAEFLQWCAIYNFNRTLALTLNLSHITLPRFRLISPTLRTQSYYIVTPPLTTQRFCRSPKCISKALLAHASNSPQKAIAPTVRMDRSGSGTCQTSPT